MTSKNIVLWPLLFALVLHSSTRTSTAATRLLFDRTAFLQSSTGIQNIDFEGIQSSLCVTPFNSATGLTLNGVQFLSDIFFTDNPTPIHSLAVVEPCNDPNFNWGS